MKAAMYAIIKKDFRIIASNRRLFPARFPTFVYYRNAC